MKLRLRNLFTHLRPAVLIICFLLWNGLGGLCVWLNGGAGRIKSTAAACSAIAACLLTVLLTLGIVFWHPLRKAALRPGADISGVAAELLFIALLTGLLTIAFAIMLLTGR